MLHLPLPVINSVKQIRSALLLPLFITCSVRAQVTNFNFRHLTPAEGLSDGVVNAFTQDRYGFIWIGTSYGLNRFDGVTVKNFFSKAGDSTSIYNNYIHSLFVDRQGRIWIGTLTGLCRFDYSTHSFIRYAADTALLVTGILQDKHDNIWIGSRTGLWVVDENLRVVREFAGKGNKDRNGQFRFHINQMIAGPDGNWYLATNSGIRVFNTQTGLIKEIKRDTTDKSSLFADRVLSVCIDSSGSTLWASTKFRGSVLEKIDLKTGSIKHYTHFIEARKKWSANTVHRVITDRAGRVWAVSSYSGISVYDITKDDFEDYTADPVIPNSLLINANISIFQDREGLIWLGSAAYGISYFNPQKTLFQSIIPPFDEDKLVVETWCRSVCEDRNGNLWLGTAKGLMKYDPVEKVFTSFNNKDEGSPVIYSNSVRAVMEDDLGDIWIGTSSGLNRYHPSTGKMDFFTKEQGIPAAFFWMIVKDRSGTIWLGSSSGLYRYNRLHNRFDDLAQDSLLSKYSHKNIQTLYTDKQDRLWIGILDKGLLMYDLNQKKLRLLTVSDSLISDTRFSSMAEDRDGFIWIGSEEKLTVYDPAKNRSRFFSKENGLPSDRTNNIMVDSLNRVWVGTSNGLCLINTKRAHVQVFNINDGLLTGQFNEQAAYRTRNGYFVYPTYKGFLRFRPEEYQESGATIPVFVTSFRVKDKEIVMSTENLQQILLRHDRNFFSISLIGLNYMNPLACLYAYKLEPFDKDWVYTKNREINYTKVPPGNYTFRYKVITDDPGVQTPEKTFEVVIGQVFYKTWWFRLIIGLLLAGAIFTFYRYRVKQREKILLLQGKAQLLEKEKTMVMYESLKQHLNPHFLFNSLTSLRSLIKTDARTATGFLDGMSKVYRYVLKSGEQEFLPLRDELDFVRTYVELQQTRFNDGLQVNIKVDESFYHKNIVPVTLQNLVENAIKHNTADRENPLVIDIFTENGSVVVRNKVQRYRIVESSNRTGLANLRSMYLFFSPEPIQVTEDDQYFTVKIPLL